MSRQARTQCHDGVERLGWTGNLAAYQVADAVNND
jgi:hypothetical protein